VFGVREVVAQVVEKGPIRRTPVVAVVVAEQEPVDCLRQRVLQQL
jgi:hypothetical protein